MEESPIKWVALNGEPLRGLADLITTLAPYRKITWRRLGAPKPRLTVHSVSGKGRKFQQFRSMAPRISLPS